MTRIIFAMALAVLGWTAASHTASAATISINPQPFAFFSAAAGPATALSNAYEFSFTGTATGNFAVLAGGISGLTTSICDDAACTNPALFSGATVGGVLLSFSDAAFNLTTGTYFLVVSGLTSLIGGGYFGVVTLDVTPSVPVPPALILFATAIVGLGGMNYFRRKRGLAA